MKKPEPLQQIEMELDCRRLAKIEVQKENPESTLAWDTLSKRLSRTLSRAELEHLEKVIRRVDYHLDLIERDRQIKRFVRMKVQSGMTVYNAVYEASRKFHLSDERIFAIWYDKNKKNDTSA